MFPIGAMDPKNVSVFGQYGPQQRTFVPMLFLIDKAGVVQGQFMGSDSIFEGDKVGNLRAAINHLMGSGAPAKKASAAARK